MNWFNRRSLTPEQKTRVDIITWIVVAVIVVFCLWAPVKGTQLVHKLTNWITSTNSAIKN
jgi:hypothetical protein